MWNEVFNLAVSNGLFAVLFCILLVYQLKDSGKRESKYQKMLSELTEKFEILIEIKDDNEQIKRDNMQIIRDNREIKHMLENIDDVQRR